MKKIVFVLIAILTSCNYQDSADIKREQVQGTIWQKIQIDGCTYITTPHFSNTSHIIHAANCPNHDTIIEGKGAHQ